MVDAWIGYKSSSKEYKVFQTKILLKIYILISSPKRRSGFAFLALFAIFAIAFAQESAPKESLKGSEAVYLASPYGYAGYAGYGAYPYAGYGVGYNAYSGLYYR
uniref:Uncharacterized protein n=1 Tax=Timema bartmani TaxID=61472 RepID=A0A7R9EWG8_9NEOP|nr:unnamed protein product [Timema bartmani]